MKYTIFIISLVLLSSYLDLKAQTLRFQNFEVTPVSVYSSKVKLMGKESLKVVKDSSVKEFDEPTFIRINDIDFRNGIIEVKVLSRLLKNAPEFARGFIGVAFRINDSNTRFESIYVRPTNARVDDQVRRNHSIQYFSYPDYKFDRLRRESPEKYESYSDLEMNRWITIRLEVKDSMVKLFLNGSSQPSLVVNDMKQGANASGAIGLWVDVGTEGYFTDLTIEKQD
jgi:hypothetical protein